MTYARFPKSVNTRAVNVRNINMHACECVILMYTYGFYKHSRNVPSVVYYVLYTHGELAGGGGTVL